DFETAEIAIKAALTGHLVLSTLHTNGAPETITRLMNMGIEPFLVATSVHLICAQRLVRRICRDCTEVVEVPVQALIEEGYSPEEAKTVKIQKGKGCGVCSNSGYKGRTGLYEVMEVDDEIRELVLVGASAVEMKKKAIERVMTDSQKHRFEENLELDFSFGLKGLARFRANVFNQRGATSAVFRLIPFEIKSFNQLGLPAVVSKLCDKPRGLVLVTGPTGSGK